MAPLSHNGCIMQPCKIANCGLNVAKLAASCKITNGGQNGAKMAASSKIANRGQASSKIANCGQDVAHPRPFAIGREDTRLINRFYPCICRCSASSQPSACLRRIPLGVQVIHNREHCPACFRVSITRLIPYFSQDVLHN